MKLGRKLVHSLPQQQAAIGTAAGTKSPLAKIRSRSFTMVLCVYFLKMHILKKKLMKTETHPEGMTSD